MCKASRQCRWHRSVALRGRLLDFVYYYEWTLFRLPSPSSCLCSIYVCIITFSCLYVHVCVLFRLTGTLGYASLLGTIKHYSREGSTGITREGVRLEETLKERSPRAMLERACRPLAVLGLEIAVRLQLRSPTGLCHVAGPVRAQHALSRRPGTQ